MGLFKSKKKNEELEGFSDLENVKSNIDMGTYSDFMNQNIQNPALGGQQNAQMFQMQQPSIPTQQPLQPMLQVQQFPQPIQQHNVGESEEIQKLKEQLRLFERELSRLKKSRSKLEEKEEDKVDVEVYKVKEREEKDIYIKIEDYKKLVELLNKVKTKLKEIDSLLSEIKDVKAKELEKLKANKAKLEESKGDIDAILNMLK